MLAHTVKSYGHKLNTLPLFPVNICSCAHAYKPSAIKRALLCGVRSIGEPPGKVPAFDVARELDGFLPLD